VQHGHKQQTGIDGEKTERAVGLRFGQYYRARAAIAFGTAFFDTFVMGERAQVLENGGGRVAAGVRPKVQPDGLPIEYENDDGIGGHGGQFRDWIRGAGTESQPMNNLTTP
jgi:hypothetical protein